MVYSDLFRSLSTGRENGQQENNIQELLRLADVKNTIVSEIMGNNYSCYFYQQITVEESLGDHPNVRVYYNTIEIESQALLPEEALNVLPIINVQVYQEGLDIDLILGKIIPASIKVSEVYNYIPISFIDCSGNTLRREQSNRILWDLKESETDPGLYEIPCTYWAKRSFIKFVMDDDQQQEAPQI